MNRKRFMGLIIMMLLSIIGIIWVQIVWIRNAVGIQNESFNHAVNVSLSNAANAIESSRKMNFFNSIMLRDPFSFNDSSTDITAYLSIGSYSSEPGNNVTVNITNQSYSGNSDTGTVTTVNKSFVFSGDTSINSDTVTLIVAANDRSGKMNIIRRSDEFNTNSRAVYMRQNEFLNWVRKRSNEFQNMSDQMISEIYQWEKTLELDNKEIEYTLKQSLSFAGIQTPFEYAVIKDGKVQDGTFSKSGKNDFLKSNYMVQLFPDNIIRQDLILSVIFPERANYVLGSMVWILGGSLIFSLFILATFALSLFFIIRQKKISEMKSDFINNMTHEFKTPIATISLAADTITNPKVINNEISIRHFISMIKKENSRMNKKVETILQIASLDKKEIEFRFENISFHTVIEHAVETIEIQVQQRNGKINLSLQATEPIIYGDSEHLTNLVNNLLDNAIKYSPESPNITLETKNNDKGIILLVDDKGVGMTKAVQSKIFERFYRQSSGNVHDVKGFGLGLNYSRAIIDAHKGTIAVISEPGKGSRFEIFLPFNGDN
ncbi:MAG TPA: HAMP domain-containing sensor histidine kinase [Bacteroidales bacterium]|nr:HAMP domain-containing sensor histidine kinase [Bacteroidales bacterium]